VYEVRSTVVVVSTEIFFADEQVVVAVQLPELAVDDIEMLVRKVVCDLVDVVFVLQPTYCLNTSPSSSSLRKMVSHFSEASDESEALQRLQSGARQELMVPRTRLFTISDRAFGVAAARVGNSLPPVATSASSLPSFKRQLKTFLLENSFH